MSTGKPGRNGRKRAAKEADEPSLRLFERKLAEAGEGKYVLRLFVTGMTSRSQRAVDNVRKLCEEHLAGRYELEIIDIYQQPTEAKGEQIIAAPTLVRKLPPPLRRIIGDMSEPGRVLVALGLKLKDE